MAQLLNPGGAVQTRRQPTHAPLPPGLMLNASKTKRRKRRISLRRNNPTRFEMMLGAVGIGSGSRRKKIRSSSKKRKRMSTAMVRTLPVGLSHRTLLDAVVENPFRARYSGAVRQELCPPGWNWNASQQQCIAPLPEPPGPGPQPPLPPVAPGMSTRTPCPPGWGKVGETPWGGKVCWPKPGTPVIGRR